MKDRIRQIMESQHMTQQGFAQFLGMSPAILSSIFNGRTKPTLNTVDAIKSKIPAINTDWLIFGNGDMYKPQSQPQPSSSIDPSPVSSDNGEVLLDFSGENEIHDVSPAAPSMNLNERPRREVIRQEVKYIDKPQRKITEIRVYFDDSTYETFEPKK
jgi:transcriptional regulator with XRE-family HTH domain